MCVTCSLTINEQVLIRGGFTLQGDGQALSHGTIPERDKQHKKGFDTLLHPILCFTDHKTIEKKRRGRNERE